MCGWEAGSVAVAPDWATPCAMINCWSTCAAASWAACWVRAWKSGSVAVVAPSEHTVGSEECMSTGPRDCNVNGGN